MLEDFQRRGYVRVPNVFTAAQVDGLRDSLDAIFARPRETGDIAKEGTGPEARLNAIARYPELQWVTAHEPLLVVLRELAGADFVWLPETAVQMNGFGSWHRDSSAQESAGHRFHLEPDYRMIQVAIYLQPAGIHGGGLEVLPGSHLTRDWRAANGLLGRVRRKLRSWQRPPSGYVIPSQAGDLVCFDYRIEHRAAQSYASVPAARPKLALFLAVSANNRHAAAYVEFLKTRPEYGYLRDHETTKSLT